jgi:hypothetical protein
MQIEEYIKLTDLLSKTEYEKAKLIAYYFKAQNNTFEFSVNDLGSNFEFIHLPKPNLSRLKKKLQDGADFVYNGKSDIFKLHAKTLAALDDTYSANFKDTETVISQDTIIPKSLYKNTRGYIEKLAKQINASFEKNIFDGCAVLMRRLIEIMLILSYEHLGIVNSIKDGNGNYFMLEGIVTDAISNTKLSLSRSSKDDLPKIRKVGNYSAHKIYYNCIFNDIDNIKLEYRAIFEELLYKSGIRV